MQDMSVGGGQLPFLFRKEKETYFLEKAAEEEIYVEKRKKARFCNPLPFHGGMWKKQGVFRVV